MRRLGQVVMLVGIMGIAGMAAAADERHDGPGNMPPEVRAIQEKYRGMRQQLQEECRQKMQALQQQQHH